MTARYTVRYSSNCTVCLSWYRGKLITAADRLEDVLRSAEWRIESPDMSVIVTDTRKGRILAEGPGVVTMLLESLFSGK